MKITLGFSPCPNDTFIFDALVNQKIDTKDLVFEVVLADVETLNEWALVGKLDFTKLSYGVLPLVLDKYLVLSSGSALGKGVGPLLIKNDKLNNTVVDDQLIAIPGENTTAHLLFSLAYPMATNKIFIRYDEIENFVLSGKGLGVIIHENRFTYEEKGLHKINDLGLFWENQTGHAIPLGGIVAKRTVEPEVAKKVQDLIAESIQYAFQNEYETLADYVTCHAQEMSEDVMRKHINLYVNSYSVNMGEPGKLAITNLLDVYQKLHTNIQVPSTAIFL